VAGRSSPPGLRMIAGRVSGRRVTFVGDAMAAGGVDITVENADARSYLQQNAKRYDIILTDVYQDLSIPFALATKEYAALLKKSLAAEGVVIANIIGSDNPCCSGFPARQFTPLTPALFPNTGTTPWATRRSTRAKTCCIRRGPALAAGGAVELV
jgi:hypothetical protein